MSFILRRAARFAAVAVAVPLAGRVAIKVAERMEEQSGPTTKSRVLRQAGGSLSQPRARRRW